jgi:hypothetical protein
MGVFFVHVVTAEKSIDLSAKDVVVKGAAIPFMTFRTDG